MTIIAGLTFSELDAESDAFAQLMDEGLDLVIAQTLNNVEFVIIAASREPREQREQRKFYTAENLSYISYYWNKYARDTLVPQLYDVLDRSAKAITSSVHAIWSVFTPTPMNSRTNQASRQYVNQAITHFDDVGVHLYDNIREQLAIGINENESIPQLRNRLMNAANLTKPRAESIARTETVAANNMASLIQVQELGGIGTKTWLAKIDDRTRETHVHADDQTVAINRQFRVGTSTLAFPGDPSGAPGEVINCRCTLTFDIEFFNLKESTLLND